MAKLTDPKAKASTRPREEGMCKACAKQRPAAAEMRATTDVVEALLRRHADAEAAAAALRADAEGAAGLRAAAAALQERMLLLEEEARATEEAREAARCEAEDTATKVAKAHALGLKEGCPSATVAVPLSPAVPDHPIAPPRPLRSRSKRHATRLKAA